MIKPRSNRDDERERKRRGGGGDRERERLKWERWQGLKMINHRTLHGTKLDWCSWGAWFERWRCSAWVLRRSLAAGTLSAWVNREDGVTCGHAAEWAREPPLMLDERLSPVVASRTLVRPVCHCIQCTRCRSTVRYSSLLNLIKGQLYFRFYSTAFISSFVQFYSVSHVCKRGACNFNYLLYQSGLDSGI